MLESSAFHRGGYSLRSIKAFYQESAEKISVRPISAQVRPGLKPRIFIARTSDGILRESHECI